MTKSKQASRPLTTRQSTFILWITGCSFALIGFFTLFLGELATLSCQRTTPANSQCHLAQSGLLGLVRQDTILVADLQNATVQVRGSRSSGWSYRVMLQTKPEALPLSQTYRADRAKQAVIAHQINTFIADPSQPILTIRQDNRWYYLLIGGLFLSIACFSLLGSRIKL